MPGVSSAGGDGISPAQPSSVAGHDPCAPPSTDPSDPSDPKSWLIGESPPAPHPLTTWPGHPATSAEAGAAASGPADSATTATAVPRTVLRKTFEFTMLVLSTVLIATPVDGSRSGTMPTNSSRERTQRTTVTRRR